MLVRASDIFRPGRVYLSCRGGGGLPALGGEYVKWLLGHGGAGVVPMLRGKAEPLAALYPTTLAALARERLDAGLRSARAFADAACRAGGCVAAPVPPALAPGLFNGNRPGEWIQWENGGPLT